MKAFFLGRNLREKALLLGFVILALLTWASSVAGRTRTWWEDLRTVRAELAAQQVWLQNAAVIETRAADATKNFDPAKVINATRLVGELSALAGQAGLSADIGSQRTERTSQFAFHTLLVNVRRAELGALVKFYGELSRRSPYIGLEQLTLVADRANPGQLSATLRVVSVELGP